MKTFIQIAVHFTGFFVIWALSSFSWQMSWKFGVGFTFGLLTQLGAMQLQSVFESLAFKRKLNYLDERFAADMLALDVMMKHPLIAHGIHADPEVSARYVELLDLIRVKVGELPNFPGSKSI